MMSRVVLFCDDVYIVSAVGNQSGLEWSCFGMMYGDQFLNLFRMACFIDFFFEKLACFIDATLCLEMVIKIIGM